MLARQTAGKLPSTNRHISCASSSFSARAIAFRTNGKMRHRRASFGCGQGNAARRNRCLLCRGNESGAWEDRSSAPGGGQPGGRRPRGDGHPSRFPPLPCSADSAVAAAGDPEVQADAASDSDGLSLTEEEAGTATSCPGAPGAPPLTATCSSSARAGDGDARDREHPACCAACSVQRRRFLALFFWPREKFAPGSMHAR
mmetsp:Transcript_148902/g.414880  ORF Transcript_148902/g.414880 Transcript_148902/m.414880 type:complete len:200 (-) Transcript_148902:128-727(-)